MSTSQPPEDDSFVAVPGLGQVKGFTTSDGVSQFLGIPYGLLKTRWTRPEAITRFECGKHDGTRHGPRCPQPSAADFSQLSVPGFPSSPLVVQDEFRCLHLNIVRPSGCTPASNLPVMVWIHGGGFSIGSNSEIAFDGIPLVKESISLGKPVIYVSINYRLGYLGFFASAKLLVESGGKSVGNYGLWDQRLALEWVQEYIEAFGGNPHAVTIFGESAGAVSVHSHMVAKSPLFHQAIVQSGALGTCSPVTLERLSACQGHDRLAEALGFTENVDLQTMRGTSATEIVEAMKKTFKGRLAAFTLLDDRQMEDGFFPPDTDFLGIQPFCKRIVIGDCENDGIITALTMSSSPTINLAKVISSLPTPLLTHFDLLNPSTADPTSLTPKILDMQSVLMFSGPAEGVISRSNPDRTFVYRMNRPNKWLSPSSGSIFANTAHHGIDLLYLHGTPSVLPTSGNESSKDVYLSQVIMRHWLTFANGQEPWRPLGQHNSRGVEMLYSAEGDATEVERSDSKSARHFDILQLVVDHLEETRQVALLLARGHH